MPNSPQRNLLKLLTVISGRLQEMEARLAALERRMPEDEGDGCDFDDDYSSSASNPGRTNTPPEPLKRGRRPRSSPIERAKRRDELVQFLEVHWIQLQQGFTRHSSLEMLLQALENVSSGAHGLPAFKHLKANLAILQDFLQSGRYNGNPRTIACALALVPEITWRSSLDYCTAHPSKRPVHGNARRTASRDYRLPAKAVTSGRRIK